MGSLRSGCMASPGLAATAVTGDHDRASTLLKSRIPKKPGGRPVGRANGNRWVPPWFRISIKVNRGWRSNESDIANWSAGAGGGHPADGIEQGVTGGAAAFGSGRGLRAGDAEPGHRVSKAEKVDAGWRGGCEHVGGIGECGGGRTAGARGVPARAAAARTAEHATPACSARGGDGGGREDRGRGAEGVSELWLVWQHLIQPHEPANCRKALQ